MAMRDFACSIDGASAEASRFDSVDSRDLKTRGITMHVR